MCCCFLKRNRKQFAQPNVQRHACLDNNKSKLRIRSRLHQLRTQLLLFLKDNREACLRYSESLNTVSTRSGKGHPNLFPPLLTSQCSQLVSVEQQEAVDSLHLTVGVNVETNVRWEAARDWGTPGRGRVYRLAAKAYIECEGKDAQYSRILTRLCKTLCQITHTQSKQYLAGVMVVWNLPTTS